jgi:hypothetical protein
VVHDNKTLRFCSSRAKLPREDQHSYSLGHSLVKMRGSSRKHFCQIAAKKESEGLLFRGSRGPIRRPEKPPDFP